MPRLNEVQFPEELQLVLIMRPQGLVPASMKCSSRRNCSMQARPSSVTREPPQ